MDQQGVDGLRRRERDLLQELATTRIALGSSDDHRATPASPFPAVFDGEALYGAILQSATDYAIIAADLGGRIVEWNVGAREVLGWPPEDILGQDLRIIFTPEDRSAGVPEEEMQVALSTGHAMDCRWHMRRDGSRFWADGRMTPLRTSEGKACGYLKILRDETGRRQSENLATDKMRADGQRRDALAEAQKGVEALWGDVAGSFAAVVAGVTAVLPQSAGAVITMIENGVGVHHTTSDASLGEPGTRVPLDHSLIGTALRLGRPLLCEDSERDDRVDAELTRRFGVRSMITVPIPRHGAFIGTLTVVARTPGAFAPRDMLAAQILVGSLATGFARTDEASALGRLRQSEERLQIALHASETIGVWDWDIETDRCFGDARFASLFSVDVVEASEGLPIAAYMKCVHPDDRVWLSLAARKAIAEGGEFAMEHRVIRADGSVIWLASRGRSYNGADGRPRRFPGAVVDITERKRVEASLREAETNARLAVEAAGLGLWSYDPVADRMSWDDRFRTIFGFQSDLDPSLDGVMTSVHPRSRASLAATVQNAIANGRIEGTANDVEIVHATDGTAVWIEVSAQPFFAGEICTRIIGTVRDITERKRLEAALREDEQRFRTMAESIPQLAWMAAPTGEIVWFNERWFDYTGLPPADDLVQGWVGAHHPDTFDAVTERLQAAFRDGSPWEDTLLLRGADGQFRWFLSRALPMRQDGDTILRWFGTHTNIDNEVRAREAEGRFKADLERQVAARTDELSAMNAKLLAEMTDRQRAEEALRQSQKMEAVGQLTGGIAHDFNNLLTGITGSLDLMRRRIEQGRLGELDRYMTAAAASANRAAALTHRLLAFARRQPLDAKPVDVNALVASMEDLLHRTIGESIEVRFDLAVDVWTTLCDPYQLENALLNLAINARDAMPDGGQLLIRTANAVVTDAEVADDPDGRPGPYVALRVSDSGIGIPPDKLTRVFEPFFTTKPIGQGTGLGLSMIYGFARQSEGNVRITSEVGVGTAITLYLPRFVGRSEVDVAAAPPAEAPLAQGETVLVVEDDAVVRGLVVEVLGELGYRTLDASDGLAGLAILQGRATIDLLVTDVGLPGLNGRQLAEMGRASRPDLKVLFITGYAEDATFGQDALGRTTQMITKPFVVDTLTARIRAMIADRGSPPH